jgi:hypothetical protein
MVTETRKPLGKRSELALLSCLFASGGGANRYDVRILDMSIQRREGLPQAENQWSRRRNNVRQLINQNDRD